MVTIKDIKGLSSIHNIPKGIPYNECTTMDLFLNDNLTNNPKTAIYDFDVYLKDYDVNLQRPYVWNQIQQQEFIMSLLLEKPIPPMVLVHLDSDESVLGKTLKTILVIDGKQRLLTIKKFLHNEFSIKINGEMVCFDSFDKDVKNFFIQKICFLTANIYYAYDDPKDPSYMSDDVKIILFNFYNFAGTQQDEAHKNMLQCFLNKIQSDNIKK